MWKYVRLSRAIPANSHHVYRQSEQGNTESKKLQKKEKAGNFA